MKKLIFTIIFLAGTAEAGTITLQPGQCITTNSGQRFCAESTYQPYQQQRPFTMETTTVTSNKNIFCTCTYAFRKSADPSAPGKGWWLDQVSMQDGQQTIINIGHFGSSERSCRESLAKSYACKVGKAKFQHTYVSH